MKANGVSLSPDKRCIFLIFLYLFGKLNNPVKFTLVWILRSYKLYIQTKQITAVTLSPRNNKEKTQSRKNFIIERMWVVLLLKRLGYSG